MGPLKPADLLAGLLVCVTVCTNEAITIVNKSDGPKHVELITYVNDYTQTQNSQPSQHIFSTSNMTPKRTITIFKKTMHPHEITRTTPFLLNEVELAANWDGQEKYQIVKRLKIQDAHSPDTSIIPMTITITVTPKT